MASRRLALNLSKGLRARAPGLSVPFRRGLATPHHAPAFKTETTTLKNGLTVSSPSCCLLPFAAPRPAANWPLAHHLTPPTTER